jgi:sulfur-oxidizing protein SoxY
MSVTRRTFLKSALALTSYRILIAAGFVNPTLAQAQWLANFFTTSTLDETLKNIFAEAEITPTDKIALQLPSIAENGAVVPITISSSLENVSQIFILVEKNPIPLAAMFDLSPEVDAFVSARLKMNETCAVVAVAQAAGKLYKAQQIVKVTIGGCGG